MLKPNPTREPNENVRNILKKHGFEGQLIGMSYDPQEGESPTAYFEIETRVVAVSNIVMRYPPRLWEWVILHECGHYILNHSLGPLGQASKENELQADLWACDKQQTPIFGIKALTRICNGNLDMSRFTVAEPLWHETIRIGPISFRYFINQIKKHWGIL